MQHASKQNERISDIHEPLCFYVLTGRRLKRPSCLLEEENRNNPHIVNGMMAPRYLSYDMDAQSVVIEYDVKDWERTESASCTAEFCPPCSTMPRESLSRAFVGGWAPTVDLQVHFLRPGQPGDTIRAEARIIAAGQTLVHAGGRTDLQNHRQEAGCLHCYLS